MITKLYEEIQKVAGDKFVVGKIYKFETCIFPPGLGKQTPETFGSQITEMAPVYPSELKTAGKPIKINFDCEQEYIKNLLCNVANLNLDGSFSGSWTPISIGFSMPSYRSGWKGVYDHIKSILFKEAVKPVDNKQYEISSYVKSNLPIDFMLDQFKILPKD